MYSRAVESEFLLAYYFHFLGCLIFLIIFVEDPITVLTLEYSKECDLKCLPKQDR
jgi:hypothetical protein